MRNGGLDLLLVLTVILALGTVIQDYRFDSSIARERAAGTAIDRELGALEVAVADLRTASAESLAADQSSDGWTRQVSELAGDIERRTADLRRGSTTGDVRERYDTATTALADVLTIDRRARDALANHQRALAAGLIRVDGRDATERLAGELAAARVAEADALDVRVARLSRLRFGMNAIALGWVMVVALYAGRLARRPTAASPAATMAQMLRELPPPVKPPVAARPAPPAAPAPAPPQPPPVPLAAAADLCVDLARLIDGRDLPALLERAVKVLQAKGVIIWTADATKTTLRPWLAQGYPEKVLMRLGSLAADDDNVTSLAFRSAYPQTMNGDASNAAGAIAVPLMASDGCSGVLAVEVREAKPTPELTALATILGAQFATLIGPAQTAAQAAEG